MNEASFTARRWALVIVVGAASSLLASVSAQMGDQRDSLQQTPPPAEWNLPAPVLAPEDALKSFRLQPGFRIELVASEPLVEAPVAIDFDADGRIWVVEMRSYMPDADGTGESEPTNRIVVLEDTDGDGRMDTRTVYMEGLHLPRLVKVLQDGVLVAEPPNLWLTRDTDGDGVADEKTAIATDYSLRETNPEGGANALTWGLDNWLVSSSYGRRLRFRDGEWTSSPTILRGQWGQSMDDYGRLFTNTNADYLRADLVPHHYHARNPNLVVGSNLPSGVNHPVDTNQELWPARVTPGVNRGYVPGELRSTGTLWNFTAVCAPLIYRGDNFPGEFYGNYFAAEPAAHVIRRSIVTEQDGILAGRNAYDEEEFLSSTDERFRPVNLYTAPDGSLYVVDMYRGILQHRQFMTTYLRRQIAERHLDDGLTFGRIYRIVHEGKPPGLPPALSRASPDELVEYLAHPNGWWRDTSRRMLIESGERSVAPALSERASSVSVDPAVRLQALWTLEGLDAVDADLLMAIMDDRDPKLRAAAVRLSEPAVRSGHEGLTRQVLARMVDPSPEVRRQVALSIGEAPVDVRDEALAAMALRDATTPFMVAAIVSGLSGDELSFIERLLSTTSFREVRPGYNLLIETLAGTILRAGDETQIGRLLELVRDDTEPMWRRSALLNGMQASGVRRLPAVPRGLDVAATDPDPAIARGAAALLSRLDWPGKTAGPRPLTTDELALVERGRSVYASACASCHQPDGRGMNALAPPLVDSTWVLGAERVLARIALKGKTGRFAVPMPALEMMSDADLAAVLTYVRRSWGHEALPVASATVGTVRRAVIVRSRPYTDQELETLAAEETNIQ